MTINMSLLVPEIHVLAFVVSCREYTGAADRCRFFRVMRQIALGASRRAHAVSLSDANYHRWHASPTFSASTLALTDAEDMR